MATNKKSNAEITSAINSLKRQKKNSQKANQNYMKSNKKVKNQNRVEVFDDREPAVKKSGKPTYKYSKNHKKTAKFSDRKASPVKLTPLGGLGEIGKNITLYEYENDMFLVDCGMSFPDEADLCISSAARP